MYLCIPRVYEFIRFNTLIIYAKRPFGGINSFT